MRLLFFGASKPLPGNCLKFKTDVPPLNRSAASTEPKQFVGSREGRWLWEGGEGGGSYDSWRSEFNTWIIYGIAPQVNSPLFELFYANVPYEMSMLELASLSGEIFLEI